VTVPLNSIFYALWLNGAFISSELIDGQHTRTIFQFQKYNHNYAISSPVQSKCLLYYGFVGEPGND
jgi:hypothetical protein